MGLEPTTFSLATRRSTTELCPPILLNFKIISFLNINQVPTYKFITRVIKNFKIILYYV